MATIVYDHQIFSFQQYGGISRYVCELASRIAAAGVFRSTVVAPLHFNEHLASSGVRTLGIHRRLRDGSSARVYRLVNRACAPMLLHAARPGLVHRTYYKPLRRPGAVPVALTVHDMIHELFAGEFHQDDPTSRNKRRVVEQADLVLCNSHSTAHDLRRLFGVPDAKVVVTHLGLSGAFAAAPEPGEPSPGPRPYLLYVGHRAGYKNFERALRAYAASPRLRSEFDFVAFGGFAFAPAERETIAALGLPAERVVRLTGSDDALARLYRHARALVYPSLYEGFGIPPLEAMASGCAVVCADTSSLPEVVGDAALRFDPREVDAIRAALESACFDDETHARLRTAGHARAALFSWERCARETQEAYRAVIG